VGALRLGAHRRRAGRRRADGVRVVPAVLALGVAAAQLTAPLPAAGAGTAARTPQQHVCRAATDLLAAPPVARRRPARGVSVRTFEGHDAPGRGGHQVRLTVAQADLGVVRLAAATGRGFGVAAGTTQLTAAAPGALVGVNGDYFAYDWSGAAVPYGPLVRGGRILRLPPGVLPVVGSDAQGRPVAGGVRAGGSVSAGRGTGRWALPVLSVNDDGDRGRADRADAADPVVRGRGVAVVTRYLGKARPRRSVEVVVRRGVVRAVGRRLPFGSRSTWGSGTAGARDVLLAASGPAAGKLRRLRRGTAVTLRYVARFADGPAAGTMVRDAVGSGAVLLRDGRNLASCTASAVRSRPRTMIAWDAGRTRLWLLVVAARGHGVPVSRYGLTYRQVTELARSLGAAEAVMVDGGGSSTMAVRSGRFVHRVDAPPDAPQRPVPDALVLVRK
jgi:hypothetical protein